MSYALSSTHKEVSLLKATYLTVVAVTNRAQMLQKSLVESDPEVAQIMVKPPLPNTEQQH